MRCKEASCCFLRLVGDLDVADRLTSSMDLDPGVNTSKIMQLFLWIQLRVLNNNYLDANLLVINN